MRGTTKFFSNEGLGFLTPDDDSKDVFVHFSSVNKDGLKSFDDVRRSDLAYSALIILWTRTSVAAASESAFQAWFDEPPA